MSRQYGGYSLRQECVCVGGWVVMGMNGYVHICVCVCVLLLIECVGSCLFLHSLSLSILTPYSLSDSCIHALTSYSHTHSTLTPHSLPHSIPHSLSLPHSHTHSTLTSHSLPHSCSHTLTPTLSFHTPFYTTLPLSLHTPSHTLTPTLTPHCPLVFVSVLCVHLCQCVLDGMFV